jgi:DnaJ-class molecular chaperone
MEEITRTKEGKLRYHASFVVQGEKSERRQQCPACEGTGKRWSNAYQGWHPSRQCVQCKGVGALPRL